MIFLNYAFLLAVAFFYYFNFVPSVSVIWHIITPKTYEVKCNYSNLFTTINLNEYFSIRFKVIIFRNWWIFSIILCNLYKQIHFIQLKIYFQLITYIFQLKVCIFELTNFFSFLLIRRSWYFEQFSPVFVPQRRSLCFGFLSLEDGKVSDFSLPRILCFAGILSSLHHQC